ncbi:formate transporter FocA [Shewanella sp. C32]|uniref:Formate transporter FocA n=1 Tax=Shewanella electrica TaxID=515560 RepID=A0ABT2FHM3_9GAMM|nr:formate transporter FocA [Shewanella electrica]MCH1923663.1 formate transporter FocA [Shewanella electrica]MCS4555758.1 formate transporter FocA [Shewanella electrica]
MKQFSEHLQNAINSGESKVNKNSLHRFAQALYGGFFIGLAFVFYVTVTTGTKEAHWGMVHLVGGAVFSLGLILVVLFGMELFTSTVLTTVACVHGRVPWSRTLKCWVEVYLGNAVGALILVALVTGAGVNLVAGGEWGINVIGISLHKLHHTWSQAFFLGVLCNIMVCLGVWLAYIAKDTGTKAMLIILPVALFVATGFEHSIANMFMLPLGLVFKEVIPTDVLLAHGYTAEVLESLNIAHVISANLIPVTLGNIVGGAFFVGLGLLGTEKLSGARDPQEVPATKTESAPVNTAVSAK